MLDGIERKSTHHRGSASDSFPLVLELRPAPDSESVFAKLACRPHCLFLDSALRDERLGRHSFVTADPFEFLRLDPYRYRELAVLQQRLAHHTRGVAVCTREDLPPFQGGAAGLIGYAVGSSLERIPEPRHDEFHVPSLAMGLYDVVVSFDHCEDRAWILSQGWPEREPARRRQRAERRLQQFADWLERPVPADPAAAGESAGLSLRELAPQYLVPGPDGLLSDFTADGYRGAVRRAVEYIRAGDVFQVNLSQRLLFPAAGDSVALYRRLRRCNPATFAGYFDMGDFQIASSSPERFLQVRGGRVESRPIKGTRPRSAQAEGDRQAGRALQQSAKDRAENVMILDLLRNDLSRVCVADSVRVTQLCGLEVYPYVLHLVSAVEGRLAPGMSSLDLIRAAFPGGSITGAPKVRAMEIIAELEPTARGPYCGSLGYLGFDGSMDLNILIRSLTAGKGWWQLPVGGGIVDQSDPQREYDETWDKASGLVRALC